MTWLLTRGILAHVDDAYEWVSTREAASRLGVSPSTVERLVRRGQLVAERVERPGGTRLLIRLDRPQEPRQAPSDDGSAQEAPAASEAPQAPSDATTRSLDIFRAIFQGNIELIIEKDVRITQQAETIADLRERVGRAEAQATQQRDRADQEHARLLAMATELGETRATRLFARTNSDQLSRECDALKAELERARRPWWRWWR